jgi:hypothetical protein
LDPSAAKAEIDREKISPAMLFVVSDDKHPKDDVIAAYFSEVCH